MKKILTALIMLLALAFSASALNIIEDNATIQAGHGTTATGSFTINNTNETDPINVSFSDYILTFDTYNLTISEIANVTISANASQQINFNVVVPANKHAGLYTGNLKASAGSLSDTILVRINVTPSYSMSVPSEIDLGTIEQNSTRSTTFTITNNGNAPLTGINISSDAASKYNVVFNQTSKAVLGINEQMTIIVNSTVPLTETAGEKTLGDIYVNSAEYNASAFPLKANIKGRLEISDLDIKVDGNSDNNVNNGDKIGEKAKSESKIEFDLKLENRYTDDEDIEIENIIVTITLEGIDDGDDLEEESSEIDIKAGDSKRVLLSFKLPLDVEEGDYNILINVEGEDGEYNIDHEIVWELELEVEKESHEIRIRNPMVSPLTVDCSRMVDLSFGLINIGKNEEDEVYYLVSNSELGINIREGAFELNDDPDDDENKMEASHTLYIEESQPTGTYDLEIRAYYDTDKIDDYQKVSLVVNDCDEEEEEEGEDVTEDSETDGGQVGEDVTTLIIGSDQNITPPPSTGFRDSKEYIALLVLLVLTATAGVVLLGLHLILK